MKRGVQPKLGFVGPGPSREALSAVRFLRPDRRADQACETEAHHVLLQPAALPGPGELHHSAAHREPGAELRWRSRAGGRYWEGRAGCDPPAGEEGSLEVWSSGFCAWDCAWAVLSRLRDPVGSLSQPACPSLDSGTLCHLRTFRSGSSLPLSPRDSPVCPSQGGQCPLL